ncbi:MAG: hypothetical protein KAX26_12380 [Anaerolineae bacterium]|nr:hypothetical protein [Anaerolineae bacterium]
MSTRHGRRGFRGGVGHPGQQTRFLREAGFVSRLTGVQHQALAAGQAVERQVPQAHYQMLAQ